MTQLADHNLPSQQAQHRLGRTVSKCTLLDSVRARRVAGRPAGTLACVHPQHSPAARPPDAPRRRCVLLHASAGGSVSLTRGLPNRHASIWDPALALTAAVGGTLAAFQNGMLPFGTLPWRWRQGSAALRKLEAPSRAAHLEAPSCRGSGGSAVQVGGSILSCPFGGFILPSLQRQSIATWRPFRMPAVFRNAAASGSSCWRRSVECLPECWLCRRSPGLPRAAAAAVAVLCSLMALTPVSIWMRMRIQAECPCLQRC